MLFCLVQLLSNYTSSCNLNCILADTVGYVSLITGDDDNAPLTPLPLPPLGYVNSVNIGYTSSFSDKAVSVIWYI
jgi:hypothetical protein